MKLLPILAGLLSVLSPCVLPVLPILAGSTARRDRRQIFFLILGFLVSFAFLQIALSIVKNFVFLDLEWLRRGGALLMICMGLAMLLPQGSQSSVLSRLGMRLSRKPSDGSIGSTLLEGLSLGLIWSPCMGPTLAATLGLLSTSEHRLSGSLEILLFGLGASLPLFLLGLGFRRLRILFSPDKQRILRRLHQFSAVAFVVLGVAILFHWDRGIESWATLHLPEWWIDKLSEY